MTYEMRKQRRKQRKERAEGAFTEAPAPRPPARRGMPLPWTLRLAAIALVLGLAVVLLAR